MAAINSTATCKKCGCSFPRPNNKGPAPKTCGSCKREANRERNRKKNRSWTHCAVCQEPLKRPDSRGTATKYCSKECGSEARKRKKAEHPRCAIDGCERTARAGSAGSLCEMHYYRRYLTGDVGEAEQRIGGHDHCHYCGDPSGGKKFCSSRCAARDVRGHPKTRDCPVCGHEYDPISGGGRDRLVCSDKCDRARRDLAVAIRRGKAGSRFDAIDPNEVFESAGYICQSCGKRCERQNGRIVSPDDAQVDHIIPISKGGTHTWGNVQLLCRTCNVRKAAKLPSWFDERQHILRL